MAACMSLCNTDDYCRTEPVCSASESFLGSRLWQSFPLRSSLPKMTFPAQIGAAIQTVAARPQQKALDYTTLDSAWHDHWPVGLALLLGACMYIFGFVA